MPNMTMKERIERIVARSKDAVFIRQDFAKVGGYDQVGRVLRELVKDGALIKVGYGVYVKTKDSGIPGRPIPVMSLIEIGLQAMAKLGVDADLGRSAKAYMAGKTTQMPMATVLNVGNARVTRKLSVGMQEVRYEK